ncbi:MAG: cobC [Rhizobium sp.]|nr:cobC [Rhizobium sp.]
MAGIAHGGGLSVAIAAYGGGSDEWLDLSTGINPNTPELPEIPAEIWNRLPDRGLVDAARAAARDWYFCCGSKVSSSSADVVLPLPVPGTQSFIQILPKLVPQGRPVAILSPTYGEYAHCFRKAGLQVDAIRSVEDIRPDHGTLVLVNPNNPDGRTFSRADLLAIHARMKAQSGHLHVDEAFGDARPELSVARQAAEMPGLTVSRSFGKFFGMAGLRLGFVFAPAAVLETIETELGPWAVSGPALYLATELMRSDRTPILAAIKARRAALQTVLTVGGLTVAGGTELFALVAHEKAAGLFEHLARAHILVRKFDYAPDWLRVGLVADEQGDRKLASALASFGS